MAKRSGPTATPTTPTTRPQWGRAWESNDEFVDTELSPVVLSPVAISPVRESMVPSKRSKDDHASDDVVHHEIHEFSQSLEASQVEDEPSLERSVSSSMASVGSVERVGRDGDPTLVANVGTSDTIASPTTQQPAEDSSEQSSASNPHPHPQPHPQPQPLRVQRPRIATLPSTRPPPLFRARSATHPNWPSSNLTASTVSMGGIEVATLRLCINGLVTGASCARIETFLRQQPGVFRAHVTLLTGRGLFEYDPHSVTPLAIEHWVASLGFQPIPVPSDALVSVVLHIGSERPARAKMFLLAIEGVASVLEADRSFHSVSSVNSGNGGTNNSGLGKSLLVEYDPEVIGARTMVRRLSAALGYQVQASSLPSPAPLQERHDLMSLGRLFIWSFLLLLPIGFVQFVAPWLSVQTQQVLQEASLVRGLKVRDLIALCCATPMLMVIAAPMHKNGFLALRLEKRVTTDMLVSLSAIICYMFALTGLFLGVVHVVEPLRCGYFLEAMCWMLVLVFGSRLVCGALTPKISSSLDSLAQTQAKTAILMEKQRNGSFKESYIDVLLVERGDLLKVLSGARVPTDGVVVDGISAIDESMVTGELAKVPKEIDSLVIGGTINAHGMLIMKATRTINESILCRTAMLVREAQASKCATQRVARGIATCLALMMVVFAIMNFFGWFEMAKHGLILTHGWDPMPFSIRFAVATLVIACPSAFNLVVPTAVTIAITTAARFGLLFKGGSALEALDRVDIVVFDKTGTLTTGKLEVVDFLIASTRKAQTSARKLWCFLASAEQPSDHAIARAILAYARKVHTPLAEAKDFESVAGCGVQCRVDGHEVFVGSLKWMLDVLRVDVPLDLAARNELFQREGCVVVCLAVDQLLCALVALQDPPRLEAALVLDRVRQQKRQAWLVTGDQRETALSVAESLGIPECCVIADALPHQKANKIRVLEGIGKKVAFVGDGVTDMAALEVAHVGIALAASADAMVGAADVVLLKDDLRDLANAFELAAATTKSFRWGLVWVTLGVLILLSLADGVLYPVVGFYIPPAIAGLAELLLCAPVLVLSRTLSRWTPRWRNPADDPLRSTEGSFVVLDINNRDVTETTPLLVNKRLSSTRTF